jgi:hypothetical protein
MTSQCFRESGDGETGGRERWTNKLRCRGRGRLKHSIARPRQRGVANKTKSV